MAFDDVIDSVKEWLNNRLKNPYFASVIAVWIVVNRIEVFGLFNFNDTQTVQDRVLWIQQQFHNKDIWGFGIFKGFSGTVWFSLIFGFITMVCFKFLKVITGIGYNFFDKGAVWLQKRDKPTMWKPIKDFEDLQKEHSKEIETLGKIRTDLINRNQEIEVDGVRLKNEKDSALKKMAELMEGNKSLESENAVTRNAVINLQKDKIEQQNELDKYKEYIANLTKEKEDFAQNFDKQFERYSKAVTENERLKETLKNYEENIKNNLSNKYDVKTTLKNINIEFKNFLKSKYVGDFEKIMASIINHTELDSTISNDSKVFYQSVNLIEFKNGLPIATDKGLDYYIQYIRVTN